MDTPQVHTLRLTWTSWWGYPEINPDDLVDLPGALIHGWDGGFQVTEFLLKVSKPWPSNVQYVGVAFG